ncbi:MAG: hypothetical protein Q9220_006098 [cf. Caloplaca sp. 1 TL-2023]
MTWNETFGKAKALEYPATLQNLLASLQAMVDIQTPGLMVSAERTEIMSSPFNFIDSPEIEDDLRTKRANHTPTSRRKHDRAFLQHSARRSHAPSTVACSPLAKVARPESKRTPKARLRHDNSQIQFAAVDSSPPVAGTGESQHLTDHQKEVRERQEQGAAAMFRDIRSSPRRPSSTERPPELILRRKSGLTKPLAADVDPSPTFPPGDIIMNEFLGSSPTPQSVRKDSVDHDMSVNLPSSPPDSPLPVVRRASSHSVPVPRDASDTHESARAIRPEDDHATRHSMRNSSPSALGSLKYNALLPRGLLAPMTDAMLDDQRLVEPQEAEIHQRPMHMGATLIESSSGPSHGPGDDMFCPGDAAKELQVDSGPQPIIATQEPPLLLTAIDSGQGAARSAHDGDGDMVDEVPPVTPTEDELAREQLLRDLEEASSQGDSQVLSIRRSSPSSPSKDSRKRKAGLKNGVKSRKRVKLPASSQHCEVVVETRKPVHGEDDCIIIDDRPAIGEFDSSSPIIKRERSSSPLRSGLQTPGIANRVSRRRTRSMTNRDSMQASENDGSDVHRAVVASQAPSEEHASKRRKICDTPQSSDTTHSAHQSGTKPPIEGSGRPIMFLQYSQEADRISQRIDSKPSEEKTTEDMTSSQVEEIRDVLLASQSVHPTHLESSSGPVPPLSSDGDTVPNTPNDDPDQVQGPRSVQSPARSPGQRMLDRFKHMLNDLKQITLWPAEEREMMKVALDVVGQVHESGFRNGRHGQ